MKTRVALAAAAALAIAACLPSRDNVNDPSRAPKAVLHVVGAHDNEGARNDPFTLDASGSSDPFHRGALRFEFGVVGSSGVEAILGANTSGVLVSTLPVVAGDFPTSGTGAATLHVRAHVSAADGNTAIAEVPAFVVNAAPIADAGGDMFVPDRRGETVVLDACGSLLPPGCTSRDPDSDSMTWTWRQVRGPTVALSPANGVGQRVTFAAPVDESALEFEVAASDGLATSRSRLRVFVGEEVLTQQAGFAPVVQVLPGFVRAPLADWIQAIADPETGEIWAQAGGPGGLRFQRFGATALDPLGEVDPATSAYDYVGGAMSVDDGRLCIAASVAATNYWLVVDSSGTVTQSVGIQGLPTSAAPIVGGGCLVTDVVGSNGAYTTTISRLDSAGESTIATLAGAVLALQSSRDGTFGVETAIVLAPLQIELRVLTAGGASSDVVTLPQNVSGRFAPAREGGYWLLDNDGSLVRWYSCGTGTCSENPDVGYVSADGFVVDPENDSMWVVSEFGELVHFEDTGNGLRSSSVDLSEVVPNSGFSTLAVDPISGAVFADLYSFDPGGGPLLLRVPAHGRYITQVLANGFGALSLDPSRGGAWFGSTDGLRVAADGSVLADFQGAVNLFATLSETDGGAWFSVQRDGPQGSRFYLDRVGPEGSLLLESPSSLRYLGDLTGGDAVGDVCALGFDPAAVLPAEALRFDASTATATLLATAPLVGAASTRDGACWFSGTDLLHAASGASTASTIALPSWLAGYPSIVGDPRDSSVWLVIDSNGTTTPTSSHIARVAADGSVTEFAAPAGTHALRIVAGDRCDDPISPACVDLWIVDGGVLYRMRPEIDPATSRIHVLETWNLPGNAVGQVNVLDVAPR